MDIYWRKYSWTLTLLVVAICSGLAARAFALYLSTGLTLERKVVSTPARGEPVRTGPREITAIVERNILCSTCAPTPLTPVARSGDNAQVAAPLSIPANLKLIVTLIGAKPGWAFAAIRDTQDQRTSLHTIGSIVPGGATIKAIRDRHVVLAQSGQEGILELHPTAADPARTDRTSARATVRKGPLSSVAAGIRRVGQGRYEVQRGALNTLLNNTVAMSREARIIPHAKEGRAHGFTLYRMRRGGVYQQLGFKNGDNIHAVNGRAITGPDSVLPIYRNLRRATHLTISYVRRGKTLTHDYTIR